QLVDVLVAGGALVGIRIIQLDGHGVFLAVSHNEFAEGLLDSLIHTNGRIGGLDIGIEAEGAEHALGQGADGVAAVHLGVGHLVVRRVLHLGLHGHIVVAVSQRVGGGNIQGFLQRAKLGVVVDAVLVGIGAPEAGLHGHSHGVLRIVDAVAAIHIRQQVLTV